MALAGNKADLYAQEEINLEKTREFAMKNGVPIYQQTSAKDDTGVSDLFLKIAMTIDKNKAQIVRYRFGYTLVGKLGKS